MSNENTAQRKMHAFMYTLLYPAFLGTFIVTLALHEIDEIEYLKLGYALFLLIYFSTQHLQSATLEDYKKSGGYKRRHFFKDIAEITLMFELFVLLGWIRPIARVEWISSWETPFLLCLSLTLALPLFVKLSESRIRTELGLSVLSFSAVLVFLSGLVGMPLWGILVAGFAILLLYIIVFVLELTKPEQQNNAS